MRIVVLNELSTRDAMTSVVALLWPASDWIASHQIVGQRGRQWCGFPVYMFLSRNVKYFALA
jgi:hypothetical protein